MTWSASRADSLFKELAALAIRLEAERENAAVVCDELLKGPSAWWAQRLRRTPEAKTSAMVQELLARMRIWLERSPADGQAITELAVSLAEELDAAEYSPLHLATVQAQALRDHAYVLAFRGDYRHALEVVERAESRLPPAAGVGYEHARISIVKALIFSNTGRGAEALALTRSATKTFLEHGDLARAASSRMTEGIVAYTTGAVELALEILTAVEHDPHLDDLGAVRVAHNIGLCLADLRQHAAAVPYLHRSVAQFAARGMTTERIRTQWVLGKSLLAHGNTHEAIPLLRRTSREFAATGLVVEGGMVALDLVEALLAANQPNEVPAICNELVEQFTRAGLSSAAITALAYLREAGALGGAGLGGDAPTLVRKARVVLRGLGG